MVGVQVQSNTVVRGGSPSPVQYSGGGSLSPVQYSGGGSLSPVQYSGGVQSNTAISLKTSYSYAAGINLPAVYRFLGGGFQSGTALVSFS